MTDSTELSDLSKARDQLVDKLIEKHVDGNDIDQLMPLLNAVDDVRAAFDVDSE